MIGRLFAGFSGLLAGLSVCVGASAQYIPGAACPSHQWVNTYDFAGGLVCSQPGSGDVSGLGPYATATQGQFPGTTTNDNASTGNIGETVYAETTNTTATVTISNASPAVVSWTGHGLQPGAIVAFTTTGSLPTGLSTGTPYYVLPTGLTANAFEVSAAAFGSAVNTSSAGSGTQTATSLVPLTNNTGSAVAAILLTAGDWEVLGVINLDGGGSTIISYSQSGLATSAGSIGGDLENITSKNYGGSYTPFAISTYITERVGPVRYSLSGTTSIYLNVLPGFGASTLNAYGKIRARRAR